MAHRSPLSPRVALVTDWLTDFGGAERVLLAWREIWPDAPIYTTVYRPENVPQFKGADIRTSFLQRVPFAKTHHRLVAPLMPEAVESFDLDAYDIVISSSSSGCSKGIITKPETLHVSYCHNPPRYLWDGCHAYGKLHTWNPLLSWMIPQQLRKLRVWDRAAADRVDYFVTNSAFVAHRIQKYYQREAAVLHPPVDTRAFAPAPDAKQGSYYLAVGRLIPYKRFDIAIQAANILKSRLRIAGTGPDEARLRSMAGPTVQFVGKVSEEHLKRMYSECQALLFPQEEDFGLTAVEVQAAGRPVIAYGAGGALETVVNNRTGIFFREQTPASLADAMQRAEGKRWMSKVIQKHAERFDIEKFKKDFLGMVMAKYATIRG